MLSCVLGMWGCGAGPVVRVTNGRVVAGRFISERSYADFLAGALAEASGDLGTALAHYVSATREGADDPELWTRQGNVRCRLAPSDPAADADFSRALQRERQYPPALAARDSCAELRRASGATSARAPVSGEDGRRRLLAVALLDGGGASRWEALAAEGLARDDAVLQVLGLTGVAETAPDRRVAIGAVALELAGSGRLGPARALAAALLSDRGEGFGADAVMQPLVARLGIDQALLAADRQKANARSVESHVALEVVAARAWVLGDLRLARELVALPRVADPDNLGAILVSEGILGRSASRLVPRDRAGRLLAPEIVLPVARDLLNGEGVAAATRALTWCDLKTTSGDALLEPLAVDLALAGAVSEAVLPGNARIELAVRRGVAPTGELLLDSSIDARHRLLALSFVRPTDAETRALADRLTAGAAVDRLVAVGVARISLARHERTPTAARTFLEAAMASDALAAASLIDILAADGPASALEGARRHMGELARTPAEHDRATR